MSLSSQQRLSTWLKHDILRVVDGRHSVILLLYSICQPPSDTVEHSILLSRLSTSFGIRTTVLAWFRSSVTSRKQYVCVEGCKSSPRSLDQGIPQGSVPWRLLYLACTSPIGMMTRSCMSPSGRNCRMIFTSLSLKFSSASKTLILGCWIVKIRSRSIWAACFHLEVPCCTWTGLCCNCEWTDHAGASCKKFGDNLRYTFVLQWSYGTRV